MFSENSESEMNDDKDSNKVHFNYCISRFIFGNIIILLIIG